MSSRRQRIKAVTNLPVRRGKPENTNSQCSSTSSPNSSGNDLNNPKQESTTIDSSNVKVETFQYSCSQETITAGIAEGNFSQESITAYDITSANNLTHNNNEESPDIKESCQQKVDKKIIEDVGVKDGERINDVKVLSTPCADKENVEVKELVTKFGGWRRPKPTISLSSACRRRKDPTGNEKTVKKEVTGGESLVEDQGVKINNTSSFCTEESQSQSETNSVTSKSSTPSTHTVSRAGQKSRSPVTNEDITKKVTGLSQCLQEKVTDLNRDDHPSEVDSSVDINSLHKPTSPKKKIAPRPNITQVRRHKIQCDRSDSNSQSSLCKSDLAIQHANVSRENAGSEVPEDECYSDDESRQSTISNVTTGVSLDNQGTTTDCESYLESEPPSPSESKTRHNCFHGSGKIRKRSNSTNKRIVEAKRNFDARFANKKPDRTSLRMFDLIYYNPTTNPMKSAQEIPKEVQDLQKSSEKDVDERLEEENVDNPDAEASVDSDDYKVPAPRVKVGPDGEIVLDEQSLVIETTDSKRSKKEIANLTVVVDTGSPTTYSTYSKKRKKSRCDWNEKDTLMFYKALQTIGTDFSLMQTLFPTRTRLDLKAKYKKEERINGNLVEKALRFPLEFDLTELEKEQANSHEKEETVEKSDKTKGKKKEPVKKRKVMHKWGFDEGDCGTVRKKRRTKKSFKAKNTANNDDDDDDDDDAPDSEASRDVENGTQGNKRESLSRKAKENRKRVLEDDYSAIDSGFDVFADVDPDENSQERQSTRIFEDDAECEEDEQDMDQERDKETHIINEGNCKDSNVRNEGSLERTPSIIYDGELSSFEEFNMNNVEPGSLVLFTAECPENPGYHVCNVFMVQEQGSARDKPECEDTSSLPAVGEQTAAKGVAKETALS